MNSNEIRKKFLEYFINKGHENLQSDSLIPSDPTVLLTLAGMLPFKPIFLGIESAKYKRVTTAQKCIRTNDINNVGLTTRHHTFFEMLGNFSFGDYFKKEAIEFAWDLLVNIFGIDKNNLVVAVYEKDDESYQIWEKDIKIPKDKIYRLDEENNFWAAGPTGPCGPCSEIYYDYGTGCNKKDCNPACDCERFLEIWNLVFIQYDRQNDNSLKILPKKNIDTGMGLERIARVLQNKKDNFDTDIFAPIFKKLPNKSLSSKIIANHTRAMTPLISDLILPSNESRGYVLRRIIRRAVLHGRKLNIKSPFLPDLCNVVIEQMSDVYPMLKTQANLIKKTVEAEEESFCQTLEHGMQMIEDLFVKYESTKKLNGEDVCKLHDTFGFPFDITLEIAAEKGFSVDKDGFNFLMEKQKSKARASHEKWQEHLLMLKAVYKEKYGKTKFLGYDKLKTDAKILSIIPEDNIIVLDKTPFYPEGGGQIGDTGIIQNQIVVNTYGEIGGIIFHKMQSIENLKEGMTVYVCVDSGKRQSTTVHHTATHLLHFALRQVLGEEVKQAGSYVGPNYLRFDFTFGRALAASEIEEVELIVNEKIKEIEDLEAKKALKEAGLLLSNTIKINDVNFLSAKLCEIPMNNLRIIGDELINSLKSGIIVLSSTVENKVLFLVMISDDLVQKGFNAGKIVKILSLTCGGGGGGKSNKAEAGGKDISKIDKAIENVVQIISQNQ